ncbi:MAG: hypothetical protein H0U32_08070 [Thermoleophilaceae bacterium]|nr:hypothetical protein [Thermoleophilaceae bacterium]
MPRHRFIRRALTGAALVATLACAPAQASPTQESLVQDDPLLLGAKTQDDVDLAFRSLAGLGVDRVRVSVFWDQVAPGRDSQEKPEFSGGGSGSPASYPRAGWAPYDRIVLAAQRTGVGLLFSVTGPAPAWATPGAHCVKAGPFRGCQEGVYKPSPEEFRLFVQAAATRYSGTYELDAPPPPKRDGFELPELGGMNLNEPPPPAGKGTVLPRVAHWSVWNEPNYPASLLPIWRDDRPRTKSQMVGEAPAHYRKLVDAAYTALDATGHGADTILIGETAPRGGKNPRQLDGPMTPAEFAREVYCLDSKLAPFRGRAAALRECPRNASERREFASRHPGLFRAQGWAHHPYSLAGGRWHPPTWRHPLPDNVPIANLGRLTSMLDRSAARWGMAEARKSIWITEYGYQTTPPDPTAGVSPARQGPLSAWGEYVAYRNPRVSTIAQFLLLDDRPLEGLAESDPGRWVTWQSGLFTVDRQPKPSLADYRTPLHVVQRGRSARAFGTLRPAAPGLPMNASVEFAPANRPWRTLRTAPVSGPSGYVNLPFRVPGAGQVRLVWTDTATGGRTASDPAPVRRSGNAG